MAVAIFSLYTLGANVSPEPLSSNAGMQKQDITVLTQIDTAIKSPHMMWVVIAVILLAVWWIAHQNMPKRFSLRRIVSTISESLAERKARREVNVGGN